MTSVKSEKWWRKHYRKCERNNRYEKFKKGMISRHVLCFLFLLDYFEHKPYNWVWRLTLKLDKLSWSHADPPGSKGTQGPHGYTENMEIKEETAMIDIILEEED